MTWGIFFFSSLCRALENQGFEITERGEIEVKGKGKMTTYFLIRNLEASEDEIMGKPQARLDSEGKQEREASSILLLDVFSTNNFGSA